jgi:poly-gamma-glutamate capsule biosynthesis protein CapA/YwtB (metallophosphatase superfamily)
MSLIAVIWIGLLIITIIIYFCSIPNVFGTIQNSRLLSITAAGDTTGVNIKKENLSSSLSSNIGNIIKSSDIFIFNLETVLVDSKENISRCEGFPHEQSVFVSNSSFADYLKLAPITIANLANNHIFECNSEGIKETKRVLTEKGIYSVGAGQNLEEACEPLFINYNGLNLAFVSYNFVLPHLISADTNRSGAASLDACNHNYGYLKLSKGADIIIIASIHLGLWSPDVSSEQVRVVNHLFESGVDIVIGHSPHMPQAIMITKGGKLAFFSLGNFIFRPDYEMPPLAHTTILPKINLYKDNKMDVEVYPVKIDAGGIPYLGEEENTKDKIISRIAENSKKFDTLIDLRGSIGYLSSNR